jgi:transcriptional regulator with XRE-family HTH domain
MRELSPRERFGHLLRTRRDELGESLRAFGERVALSASYLHDLEHGRRDPPLDSAIVDALRAAGVASRDELFALAYEARGVIDVSDLRPAQLEKVVAYVEKLRGRA